MNPSLEPVVRSAPQVRLAPAQPAAAPRLPERPVRISPLRPRSTMAEWGVRLALLAVLLLSILMVYWSFSLRLQPVHQLHQEKARELSRLSDELDALRLPWNAEEIEQLRQRLFAARERLFQSDAEVAEWEEEMKKEGDLARVAAEFTIDPPEDHPEEAALNILRATLTAQPHLTHGATNGSYQRLIEFARTWQKPGKRWDLLELKVAGDSNSVSQATAVFQLLGRKSEPHP